MKCLHPTFFFLLFANGLRNVGEILPVSCQSVVKPKLLKTRVFDFFPSINKKSVVCALPNYFVGTC